MSYFASAIVKERLITRHHLCWISLHFSSRDAEDLRVALKSAMSCSMLKSIKCYWCLCPSTLMFGAFRTEHLPQTRTLRDGWLCLRLSGRLTDSAPRTSSHSYMYLFQLEAALFPIRQLGTLLDSVTVLRWLSDCAPGSTMHQTLCLACSMLVYEVGCIIA